MPPKNQLRNLFLFISILVAIVALFHCPYFLYDYNDYSLQLKSFWQIGLTKNFIGLFSTHLLLSLFYLTSAFTLLGMACYGAGLLYLIYRGPRFLLATVLWWIIPLGFYGNVLTSVPRFFTTTLPAFIIPMSFYLAYFLRGKNKILKILALVCFLTIIGFPLMMTKETFVRRHHYALIVDLYRWVGAVTQPNALIISSDDGPFVTYYANRKVLIKPERGFKHLLNKQLIDFKKAVDQALNNRTPVYLTEMGLDCYNYYGDFPNFMQQNYRLTWVGRKPLELWYFTPFNPYLIMSGLIKVEKK